MCLILPLVPDCFEKLLSLLVTLLLFRCDRRARSPAPRVLSARFRIIPRQLLLLLLLPLMRFGGPLDVVDSFFRVIADSDCYDVTVTLQTTLIGTSTGTIKPNISTKF